MLVNFYTLTSKKKIFLFIFLTFFALILIDLVLFSYANYNTTKTSFIGDKKLKYFELNQPYNKDIIFVGSSRTLHHISTQEFKNHGFDIFNLGIEGYFYADYPNILKSISNYKPKQVVISLSVNSLYEKLKIAKNPTLQELKTYYDIDFISFCKAFINYIVDFHAFLRYSDAVYNKIIDFYNKFNFNTHKQNKQKTHANNEKIIDCKVFSIDFRRAFCTNGDGILLHKQKLSEAKNKQHLSKINQEVIDYINHMLLIIKSKNIKITLILEPILHNPFSYDLKQILKNFKDIEILDFTNATFADELWADDGHLNDKGRIAYSRFLLQSGNFNHEK